MCLAQAACRTTGIACMANEMEPKIKGIMANAFPLLVFRKHEVVVKWHVWREKDLFRVADTSEDRTQQAIVRRLLLKEWLPYTQGSAVRNAGMPWTCITYWWQQEYYKLQIPFSNEKFSPESFLFARLLLTLWSRLEQQAQVRKEVKILKMVISMQGKAW